MDFYLAYLIMDLSKIDRGWIHTVQNGGFFLMVDLLLLFLGGQSWKVTQSTGEDGT